NKTVDMPVAASQFHKLTTTGQFVLQTSDGEDLVASCVSFVASGADYEPIKKHVKLNKTWQQLEIGDDPLVVFFRNVTVVGVGDVLDHSV
ncbi:hypothetical protein, partial [Caballeronia sp. GAOx1]|uniref:hypothetical protein n=1 Tax=Caballeronia sp. GAOx1 TaxID=2921761 RepID=UPI0020284351